ncbi:SMP-30/gluconolactonase/LRE family protein [Nocardia asteroides]|uniref:SMP-30/gluconolactonase/LRE family protein n=1 Tax=Nocardia asteroides TaxID=1824 RepID=UPI00342DA1B0
MTGANTAELTTLLSGLTHTEGPRWYDGRLWFVDLYTESIRSCRADGSDLRIEIEVPGSPSGMGWLPDGRLLFVAMRQQKLFVLESDGTATEYADLSPYAEDQVNDLAVAADGTAYVGAFGFDIMTLQPLRTQRLMRVSPDRSVSLASEPLHFPNGSVITDGGKTLVVAESFANRLSGFDILDDGSLGRRYDWARFGDVPTTTDIHELGGLTVVASDGIAAADAEGAIWVADFVRGRAVRVVKGGEITDEVSTGDLCCYAVALGGEDGKTLFLCATPADFDPETRKNNPESKVFSVQVSVPVA